MTKLIVLREYQSLGYKDNGEANAWVSKRDWKEIRDYVQDNPTPEGRSVMEVGSQTIKAKNYVGVIQTRSGTTIEILPKVDLGGEQKSNASTREREIFLKMLRRWRDGPCRTLNNADIKAVKNFPLLEAFITMFLKDMHELTRRGLACAYTEIEENRHYLKGKLLMAQQLRHNLVHKERFYVRYEEFSANRPINRLLKSTLLLLERLSRTEANLSHIRQALLYFEDIPRAIDIDIDLIRARVDRTMPLYNRLFPWARLFLKHASPTTWKDSNPALTLLFPMEQIFEHYVAHVVQAASPGWKVGAQERRHYLVEKNQKNEKEFQLRPDIVARRACQTRIMDAKWKHLNRHKAHYGIHQADLYQLYAYGKKYQREAKDKATLSLYLLYPYNEAFSESLEFGYEAGLRLTAFPVNLALEEGLAEETHSGKTLRSLLADVSREALAA